MRIFRDLEVAFHTDPMDGFGVDYELYEGTFFGRANQWLNTAVSACLVWLSITGLLSWWWRRPPTCASTARPGIRATCNRPIASA